jgi:hypothetical protein
VNILGSYSDMQISFQECDDIKTKNQGNNARNRKIVCMSYLALVAECSSDARENTKGMPKHVAHSRFKSCLERPSFYATKNSGLRSY